MTYSKVKRNLGRRRLDPAVEARLLAGLKLVGQSGRGHVRGREGQYAE